MSSPFVRLELPKGEGEKMIVNSSERIVVVDPDNGVEVDISPIVRTANLPVRWGQVRTLELEVLSVVVDTT